ncbi:MAG: glycogen debranching protein [Burkholderiales bacterium]
MATLKARMAVFAGNDRWTEREGMPSPLGVCFVEQPRAYNFALYSKHATGVVLLLYTADDPVTPLVEYRFDALHNKSGRVWHCRLPANEVDGARFYAYRVEGPFDVRGGHRFDHEKILLDPYAQQVYFPRSFSRAAATGAGGNDGRAPLGVIHACRSEFDWKGDLRPHHAHDSVIYELHVRGFTRRANSGVSEDKRGTYAGLIEKIPYLKELGVTVVELLPVHQRDPQERNYWGYMTLNFFSPEHSYAAQPDQALDEFREMVRALHEAAIEVILDVAYSHTTEVDENGPTYTFRGIDNTTYYLLQQERRWYRNDTGCGNVLHTANVATRKLVLDSMRYWFNAMHVDGFRFDLASIFSRTADGSINLDDPPIISEISSEPEFAAARLVAEAWDLATYQLGRRFPGIAWQQWNGRYRDDVRAFMRGDNDTVCALITRLYGSDDLFPDTPSDAYHAYQTVNYVNSHDGFNLYDLVAYNAKHNLPNGEQNRDGTDDNRSWNCGHEGDQGVTEEVLALRKRQAKNFCALLMLSNGTPMFCAGDEFLHTQRGNNNPYNQDDETTWLDWDRLAPNRDVFRFFKQMIAFRKSHPSLARSRYWRGDVQWYGPAGEVDQAPWSHTLAFFLRGESEGDADLYVMVNAHASDVHFAIQQGGAGAWLRVVDTALESPDDICEPGSEAQVPDLDYTVKARSVVLLLKTERAP